MSRYTKAIGDWGEEQACLFLERNGFKILERNYHSTQGEIDIIAQKMNDFYFIEVKTRTEKALATDYAITASKKYKFEKTIKHFCYHREISDVGIVKAGLLVFVNKVDKKISLRLAIFY